MPSILWHYCCTPKLSSCSREGKRRSGVTLAMRQRLSDLSIYRLMAYRRWAPHWHSCRRYDTLYIFYSSYWHQIAIINWGLNNIPFPESRGGQNRTNNFRWVGWLTWVPFKASILLCGQEGIKPMKTVILNSSSETGECRELSNTNLPGKRLVKWKKCQRPVENPTGELLENWLVAWGSG